MSKRSISHLMLERVPISVNIAQIYYGNRQAVDFEFAMKTIREKKTGEKNLHDRNELAARKAGLFRSAVDAARKDSRPLLSADEEFEIVGKLAQLRRRIDQVIAPLLRGHSADDPLDHFDQRIRAYYSLPAVESGRRKSVGPLLARYVGLKHRLVLANLPWVTKLARAQRHSQIPEDDLFQEGVSGLLKAIDRFEAERGLRLMTYATWYIREAMQQIRAKQTHLVSLSAHDQTLLGQLETIRAEFQHENKRLPSAQELGTIVGKNSKTLSRLYGVTLPPVRLDAGTAEGSIPIAIDDPSKEMDNNEEIRARVFELLGPLSERERAIICQRFGIGGDSAVSLHNLGEMFQVSKERIRQIQRQALQKMQRLAGQLSVRKARMIS